MSSERLLHALLGPSLEGAEAERPVLELYVSRLQELEREPINRYLAENRADVLGQLPGSSARTEFVLRGWLASEPGEWAEWAEHLEDESLARSEFTALAAELAGEMAGAVAREQIEVEKAIAFLHALSPALEQADADDVEAHLAPSVEAALAEREWWVDEGALRIQAEMHDFVRQVEEVCPASAKILRSMRSKEVLAPMGEEGSSVGDLLVLRGWRDLGLGLPKESYWELAEAVPGPDAALDPTLQAEALATRLVLDRLNPSYRGSPNPVSNYIAEIRRVQKLDGDFRSQIRTAASACMDLSPSAVQMHILIRIIYSADEEQRKALAQWAGREGRTPTTTLIKRLVDDGFYWDWMPAFQEASYEEAPVIRTLKSGLLDKTPDNPIRKRKWRARTFAELGLRTKAGQDQIVKLVIQLLGPKRFQNDLEVVLILCSALEEMEGRNGKVASALIAYSKRWKHKFTPSENEVLVAAGVRLPEDYLSKKAKSGMRGLLTGLKEGAEEAVKTITRPL